MGRPQLFFESCPHYLVAPRGLAPPSLYPSSPPPVFHLSQPKSLVRGVKRCPESDPARALQKSCLHPRPRVPGGSAETLSQVGSQDCLVCISEGTQSDLGKEGRNLLNYYTLSSLWHILKEKAKLCTLHLEEAVGVEVSSGGVVRVR